MLSATASLYVILGSDLAIDVSIKTPPDGRSSTYRDVVVCPIRNCGPFADGVRESDRFELRLGR